MKDLISREELLAAYDAAHKGPPGGARKLILEAQSVYQWIPVSKKPKSGTDVLLQFEKNMAVGFYSCGDWNVNSGNGFYTGLTASEDQPIAWMPLPEKYSEDVDE